MLLIPCPNCGPRNVSDMACLGEVVARPHVEGTTTEEWRRYLYMRVNSAGWVSERWFCRAGCRRFFTAERHMTENRFRTATIDEILEDSV